MDDDEPAGLVHRRGERIDVQRAHRAQVDDLERASFVGSDRRGIEAGLDHRPIAGERQVTPLSHGAGREEVERRGHLEVDLALLVIAPLGLVEDHRVVGLDGLLDHPVGVGRVGAEDDLEPERVGEVGLIGLAVMLDRADASTHGDAHDDGHLDLAVRARVQLGELGDDLVEGGIDEAVELDLHDRPIAPQGHADRGAHDPRLSERCVDDAVLAEVLLEVLGDPEDPAELADVLTGEDDLGVLLHRRPEPGIERLGDRHLLGGHQDASPSTASKDSR